MGCCARPAAPQRCPEPNPQGVLSEIPGSTGNIREIRLDSVICLPKLRAISTACERIPVAASTGNFCSVNRELFPPNRDSLGTISPSTSPPALRRREPRPPSDLLRNRRPLASNSVRPEFGNFIAAISDPKQGARQRAVRRGGMAAGRGTNRKKSRNPLSCKVAASMARNWLMENQLEPRSDTVDFWKINLRRCRLGRRSCNTVAPAANC